MSSHPLRQKRFKPTTREGRKRAARLRAILRSSNASAARKNAALVSLNALAPVARTEVTNAVL